jgi:hypothetical protein
LETLFVSRAAFCFFLLPLLLAIRIPAHALPPDQIAFAVPDPGRITLGVFDKTGRLVRLLHALDGEEKFQVGLNGYITSWDGLDSNGQRVPPGTYHIRGYLIGDVEVAGEAFHFNDWITDSESPDLETILDFDVLPDGDLVILGKTPAFTVCARVSLESGFRWVRETGARSLLACNSAAAILDDLSTFSLADGKPLLEGRSNLQARMLAADTGTVLVGGNDTLDLFPWPLAPTGELLQTPSLFTSADLDQNSILGASPDGVWISLNRAAFQKIDLPVLVRSVSLGQGESFWFAGTGMDPGQTPVVGQASFTGEILRVLLSEPAAPEPKKIRASKSAEGFVILEESPQVQRLRALSRDVAGAWIIDWEKTIRRTPSFGFVDGEPAADAGDSPQLDSLRFRLEENPLSGEKKTITFRAIAGPDGTRLVNEDGLPLVQISDQPGIRRVLIHRSKATDSLRVLQGDGAVVEEFLIEGLRHILPLNAGQIEIR